MAELLTEAVALTHKLEGRLGLAGSWPETSEGFDFDADPAAGVRIAAALLLRKARVHTVAVLRANETSNLHSLAVQMRPVVECAGQVVFFFHNAVIAPDLLVPRERAAEVLGTRVNADHFQTLRRVTKGGISPEELREVESQAQQAAAASVGATKPKRRKQRRFTQAEKVAPLPKGREWYTYLSEHFSHAKVAEWRGLSWRGGVISVDKVQDEFAFLGLMSYLVNQVAHMNAAAALCPVEGDESHLRKNWVEPALAQLDHVRQSSKALVSAARIAATGRPDGDARTS